MARIQDFPVGLVAPRGPTVLFCRIMVIGTDWYLGEETAGDGCLQLVTGGQAKVFTYPKAESLCPDRTFEGMAVKFETYRIEPRT